MDIMDFRERSFAKLAGIADKLGCDISGSTDDVDLCMVTHCRNPIGYAVLCGNPVSYTHLDVYKRQEYDMPLIHCSTPPAAVPC